MKTRPSIQSRVKIKDDMCELMGIFSWQVHKGAHTMEGWNKRNYWILIIQNYIQLSNCRKHVSYSVDRYAKAWIPWNVKTWSRTHLTMEATSKQVFLWDNLICKISIKRIIMHFGKGNLLQKEIGTLVIDREIYFLCQQLLSPVITNNSQRIWP